jgi:hypothetical protein
VRELFEKLSEKIFSDPDQRRALALFAKTACVLGVVIGLLIVFVPIAVGVVREAMSSGQGLSLSGSASVAFCVSLLVYMLLLLVEGDEVFGNYKRAFQGFLLFFLVLSLLLSWVF